MGVFVRSSTLSRLASRAPRDRSVARPGDGDFYRGDDYPICGSVGYLLRQDVERPEAVASYTVTLPTSKAIVASRLNLTPEHFSRILHELAAAGLIEVNGRAVRIPDLERLRRGA